MEYHDFICLLKNAVIPLLPLIGVSACLSPERKDGDQPQSISPAHRSVPNAIPV